MKKISKLLGLMCIVALLLGSYQPSKARDDGGRQPPDSLKELCYEKLWDVLLHPTNSGNNRTRQDSLHQLAEILSKVGYPIESNIPSRRDFAILMNDKKQDQLYKLIDDGLIDLCMLIRDPIPIQTTLTVDCAMKVGNIKDFRQVNDGIIDHSNKMKELEMQSIRTHDAFGELDPKTKKLICGLDMHYLYPDTSKDPLDPASYEFDIMDRWVQKIHEIGATVFFRVGESWGMDPTPPKNVDHYVQAVVQILKHYHQGWANGFSYHIPYWEIWNEPGLKVFWTGSSSEFIELYGKIAMALKQADPSILVGGPGNAGNFQSDWYFKFLAYIRDNHIPFDFYSWHWYGIRPYEANIIAKDVQKDLESFGFYHTKQMITEWNIDVWGSIEGKKVGNSKERDNQFFDSPFNAAFHGCVLTHLQDTPVIAAYHYRGDVSGFRLLNESGDFNRVGVFYQNLNTMMTCPQRLSVVSEPVQEAFTCLAGRSMDGNKIEILVSDARLGENPYQLDLINVPVGKKVRIQRFRLQNDGSMKIVEDKEMAPATKISLSLSLPAPSFERIEILLFP